MKVQLGNIVKYHDDKGNVFTGTVCEIHPDGEHYLFTRFNAFSAHGWFKEANVFYKVLDKCEEHNWDIQCWVDRESYCNHSIACTVCSVRYSSKLNRPIRKIDETN